MKEKNPMLDKIRRYMPEMILGAIGVLVLILAIVYIGESRIKFFISAAVIILDILGIHSIVKYKKEALNQGSKVKHLIILQIIWDFSIALSFLAVWYKIFYSKIVIEDNSYWIYSLLVWYVIISGILKYIIRFLQERKRIIEEKEGFPGHFLNVLYIVWAVVYLNIFAFYWLHIPKKTYNLANAPKPSEIHVYEHINRKWDLETIMQSHDREVKIDDDKLLDNFTKELSKNIIETLRGVKYLRYSPGSRKETCYNIWPMYKDDNGNGIKRPYEFEKMYFDSMTLYKNGELILENYIEDWNILIFRYRTELYKVNLSQELADEIIGLLESESPGVE